jgi:peptidoglycan hydrolase-like protein with peptidoglycan-binding domain
MRLRSAIPVSLALLLVAGGARCASKAASAPPAKSPHRAASAAASKAGAKKTSKRTRRRERGQKAPTADRISEIQQALAKDGSFAGKPNGKWDDSTVEAMRKFQAGHGLNPSGKLDAPTLQKLGLGSQTAGVAAPLPPANSSSLAKGGVTQSAKRD